MGEKETAAAKASGGKKDETQAYVQDNSPNSEEVARKHEASMAAIQNMR
jgi:hypothetical protein